MKKPTNRYYVPRLETLSTRSLSCCHTSQRGDLVLIVSRTLELGHAEYFCADCALELLRERMDEIDQYLAEIPGDLPLNEWDFEAEYFGPACTYHRLQTEFGLSAT